MEQTNCNHENKTRFDLKSQQHYCLDCIVDLSIDTRYIIKNQEKNDIANGECSKEVLIKLIKSQDKEHHLKRERELNQEEKYIDFILQMNNQDLSEYFDTLKTKYKNLKQRFKIFMQSSMENELKILSSELKGQNPLIDVAMFEDWQEKEQHYRTGGEPIVKILEKYLHEEKEHRKESNKLQLQTQPLKAPQLTASKEFCLSPDAQKIISYFKPDELTFWQGMNAQGICDWLKKHKIYIQSSRWSAKYDDVYDAAENLVFNVQCRFKYKDAGLNQINDLESAQEIQIESGKYSVNLNMYTSASQGYPGYWRGQMNKFYGHDMIITQNSSTVTKPNIIFSPRLPVFQEMLHGAVNIQGLGSHEDSEETKERYNNFVKAKTAQTLPFNISCGSNPTFDLKGYFIAGLFTGFMRVIDEEYNVSFEGEVIRDHPWNGQGKFSCQEGKYIFEGTINDGTLGKGLLKDEQGKATHGWFKHFCIHSHIKYMISHMGDHCHRG